MMLDVLSELFAFLKALFAFTFKPSKWGQGDISTKCLITTECPNKCYIYIYTTFQKVGIILFI